MKPALKISLAVTAAAMSLAAVSAQAAPVYDLPSGVVGNQPYGDDLGLDFTVTGAVKITGLGAFDSAADGISTNIFVGIFDLTNQVYVSPILNFNATSATGGSGYAFQSISPFILGPGNYSVVATGFNGIDPNFNTNISPGVNGSSPILFDSIGGRLVNGTSRYGGGANPAGGTVFPFQSAFAGGTLVATAVPEPATWGLMMLGFGMMGVGLRYRTRKPAKVTYA